MSVELPATVLAPAVLCEHGLGAGQASWTATDRIRHFLLGVADDLGERLVDERLAAGIR